MSNPARIYTMLFLCTGNSARSIMAEAILNRVGAGKFRAFSAGSHPKGTVHPVALALLDKLNHDVSGLHSKSWDEFAKPGAPPLDFVVTLCDQAAGEVCPLWPGQPMTAHWGFPDPAAFVGDEVQTQLQFAAIYGQIERLLSIFVSLPLDSLDNLALERRMRGLKSESNKTEPAR